MKVQSKGAFYRARTQELGGNTNVHTGLKQPEPGSTVHCDRREGVKERGKVLDTSGCLMESTEKLSTESSARDVG